MEIKKQSWIILLILSIAEGAVINSIQNTPSPLIPCEEGWYLFGNKCYKVFEKSKGASWKSAEASCVTHHGNLVTIQSKELLDFLTAFLLLDVKKHVWIGLHDLQEESNYTWADGSIVNYTYWGYGEPSGRRSHEEDCVQMRYQKQNIGRWNDCYCTTRMASICQTNKSEESMNHDPRFCTGKNDGAWKYQHSCYHTVNEEMTWDDAENYCQTVLNGHLLAIIDFKVEFFINYVLSDFNREFWIGIKIRDTDEQMWSSGWIVKYQRWLYFQTPETIGTCAYMTQRRQWSTVPCSRKLPFVCEVPNESHLKKGPKGWRCPELSQDWIDLGGESCYIFETNERKNWQEANFVCSKKGGRLASISSVAEENAIHLRVMGGPETMLIGLHRSVSNNYVFEWADGTVLDYQHWGHNQPDIENDGCTEITTDAMDWHDISCDFKRGYICSAKKVPPFHNESASIYSQLKEETNCSADASSNTSLVLLLAALILSVVGFTVYIYRNQCVKMNQRWKYFTVTYLAKNRTVSSEPVRDDTDYII